MAGEEGDDVLSPVIQADHRGIRGLAADVGGDLPHRDAAGSHEDHGVRPGEELPVKGSGRAFQRLETVLRIPLRGEFPDLPVREGLQHPAGGVPPLTAVAEEGQLHLLASRNSVVKPGSYRRLRSYLFPRQPPTMMRLVLVRLFFVTVSCRVPTVQRKTR